MTIEKIEDIIIPKRVIGIESGWEDEIFPIIEAYSNFIGDDLILPTSLIDIQKCEKRLNTSLPHELKLFYLKFGPAKLSEGLFSVTDFEYITIEWEQEFLNYYNKEERDVLSKLIVFGDYLGNGNVWCFHKDTKEIFYYDHDSMPNINGMFKTFYEYLQSLLIFTQGQIGQDIENFDDECEKIVINLIGEDRVKVWQYFKGWD